MAMSRRNLAMSCDQLFVYGTLRLDVARERNQRDQRNQHNQRDPGHDMARRLHAHATVRGKACFQGRLYLIDWYPGLTPSSDPADRVVGQLYRMHQPALLLPELDAYEGCSSAYDSPTEYVRRVMPIERVDGRRESAWVYLYNWPVDPQQRIASGDFLESQGGGG